MEKTIKITLAPILILLLFCTGCAYTPMTVNLEPDTQTSTSELGNGRTVLLHVVDERPTQHIGHRGAGISGATISLEQDLTAVVQSAVSDMLQQKGFDVTHTSESQHDSSLRVDIRGLTYSTSMGFWTGGVRVTAAIRAEAVSSVEKYDNFYRYDSEDRVVVVPTAASNNEKINAGLNDVLRQMFGDQKLLEVLTAKP